MLKTQETAGTEQSPSPLTVLLSDGDACNGLPLFDYFAVACCPILKIREHGNTRINRENDCRFVAEVNRDVVVARGNVNLDVVSDLAFDIEDARNSACVGFWFNLVFSHCASLCGMVVRAASMRKHGRNPFVQC